MTILKNWFSGPSYQAQSEAVGREKCINLYAEATGPPPYSHARGNLVYYGTPGLLEKYDLGNYGIRGMIETVGRVFAVMGDTLYELNSDLSYTSRGTVTNDGNPVSMDSNRIEVCIVSGTTVYIFTLATNVLAPVAGLSLSYVIFVDGYFAGPTPDSQQWRISGQYDGTTWDALDFTSAEGDPDDIVVPLRSHRNVWILGKQSIEEYYNSGNADFPFERLGGALIEEGCAAKFSAVLADNAPFWLGASKRGEGIFFRADGYNPQRISTHAIEHQLSTYSTISDCIGYTYTEKGHPFVVWTFPTADKTWVYDVATGLFHERGEWHSATSTWKRHRAQNHVFAFGMHLVGDYDNGKVYEQSMDHHDDNGTAKKWMRSVPIPNANNVWMFPSNLELIAEVGKGAEPTVILRYSKDGGYTFGDEKWRTLGAIGNYGYRCRWAGNLGRARHPFIEMSGDAAVQWALINAVVDVEMGTS